MGIMQEPCFVPNYVDANTTDEEFMKLLDSCLPAAIVARIEALGSVEVEELESDLSAAEEERDEAKRLAGEYEKATNLARNAWDTLRERLDSADENAPVDVIDMETRIQSLEGVE